MIEAPCRQRAGDHRVVVLDAGKSTVRAAVFAGERTLARHDGNEGFPHPRAPGAQQIVIDQVQHVLRRLGHGPYDLVVLATTGVRAIGPAELELQTALARDLECEVLVENDVVAAYLGALGPHPGILVQAGTGSLVLGACDDRTVRLDGWGHVVGDRGSGFALGRAGLRAAYAAVDGTGSRTALTEMLTGTDPEQVIRDLYASPTQIRDVAALAPIVLRAAADGDGLARDAVIEVASQLVALILAAGRRLGDPHLSRLPVVRTGGLFADDLFAGTVTRLLQEHGVVGELRGAAADPLEGGRLLAATRDATITHLLTSAVRSEDP
ncbi:MAG: hypothetical protein L0G94_15400 [Brachybacterium sp.]|uniref:N-acetylglucosamine kinase n=1 Tax=Brachybacterium sp. TaxID=1891286 RepID=UPI00264797E2|nr:BadF/BadG/BcrA/BcrD ATPase family protein [Brachybacterium sp.]MDN5688042.1 hypothetical protein [Brachybacterium sp.]